MHQPIPFDNPDVRRPRARRPRVQSSELNKDIDTLRENNSAIDDTFFRDGATARRSEATKAETRYSVSTKLLACRELSRRLLPSFNKIDLVFLAEIENDIKHG